MRVFAQFLFFATYAQASPPIAHWAFDGETAAARLAESRGNAQFNAAEAAGTSAWLNRPEFGGTLANASAAPYLAAPAPIPGSGSFSISLWSYRTASLGSTAGLLDALSAAAGSGWQLFYQANNTIRIRLDDTAGNFLTIDTAAAQAAANVWKNIIVTVDRPNAVVRIHVDGAEATPGGGISIATLTAAIIPDQALWIGTLNTTSPAHGYLDDVALFERVLTPGEIAAIGSGTPLATLYPVTPPPPAPPAVIIHPRSGSLRPGQVVSLGNGSDSPIHFTTDGKVPGPDSPLYTAPFALDAAAAVQARSISGGESGAISTAHFASIPAQPPDILIIIADNLGFNDLSCYGAVSIATPRLDALAADGRRFTQFTTTGPGDVASQHALLTGRLARRGGLPAVIPDGLPGIDSREWTLAEALRKAGYSTAFFGDWHLGTTAGSTAGDQGFQSSTNSPGLADLTSAAEAHLATPSESPRLIVFQPSLQAASGPSLLGTYGNAVEAFDASVGRLVDQLHRSGDAAGSLVVFLSDGGAGRNPLAFPIGSNGQLRDGMGTTWEGGVRVPAIVHWPGTVSPGDSFAPFWLPDLPLSLVDIAAAWQASDRPLDGSPRSHVLLGAQHRPAVEDPPLFLHRHDGSAWRLQALRSGAWKLHLTYQNSDPQNTTSAAAPLLFDLFQDPGERINRAATHSATASALQAMAAAHQASFATPAPQLPPPRAPILGAPLTVFDEDSTLILTFTRPLDSLDDHYRIQRSTDLDAWEDLPIAPFVTARTLGPDSTETLRLSLPLGPPVPGDPKQFVRLIAKRP